MALDTCFRTYSGILLWTLVDHVHHLHSVKCCLGSKEGRYKTTGKQNWCCKQRQTLYCKHRVQNSHLLIPSKISGLLFARSTRMSLQLICAEGNSDEPGGSQNLCMWKDSLSCLISISHVRKCLGQEIKRSIWSCPTEKLLPELTVTI